MTTILTSKYAYINKVHSDTRAIDITLSDKKEISSSAISYRILEDVQVTREDHSIIVEGKWVKVYYVSSHLYNDFTSPEEACEMGLVFDNVHDVEEVGFFRKRTVLGEGYYEYKDRDYFKMESTLPYTIVYVPEKK